MVSICKKWLLVFFLPHLPCLSNLSFLFFLFFISSWFFSSYYLVYLFSIHFFYAWFSSSKTINLEYLIRDPRLRVDDFNLIVKFKEYDHSSKHMDEVFSKKIEERPNAIDAFVKIIHVVLSCLPFYKRLSSSNSSHPSSSSKSYHDSSRHHLYSSSSKSYHDSSRHYSHSSSSMSSWFFSSYCLVFLLLFIPSLLPCLISLLLEPWISTILL